VTYDVLVIGAGPAGSVVARRLAAHGARVALVGAAARGGCEGLSARSRALLVEEGLDELDLDAPALELSAGMRGPFARRGVWAQGRVVEGREWLVDRRRLAGALCAHAARAGVDWRADTVVDLGRHDGSWHARLRAGGTVAASQMIDARGRRGAECRGPLLLAVGRAFDLAHAGAPGTHIHAARFGWCWWAVGERGVWVQVVARPRSGGRMHPDTWIAAAAAEIPPLAGVLAGAAPGAAAVARPAHARLGRQSVDVTRWAVGDAALALDPLSGQGVYEALRGARLVATAVHSVSSGGDAALAHRFVAERQADAWARGVALAAGFYRDNAGLGDFWASTAAAYEASLPEPLPAAPHFERRPVMLDGCILERDVIVTADHPRGVWHVAGVPLKKLSDYLAAAEHGSVHGAAAVLDRPPAAVASALRWLRQTGMVPGSARPRTSGGSIRVDRLPSEH